MSHVLSADYGQQFLLPPALEDWVPKDHPVRFLREFVDQLELGQLGFVVPDGSAGRPPYSAGLLLKIWLYGYLHRVRSTRRLEAACREHLALLWLTGLLSPDHNTLWRFWRDNKKGIRALFKHSAQLAAQAGLVGLVLQALDGTKIQAMSSGRTGWTKEYMSELLAELDAELERAEKQIAQEGALEETDPGYQLPEALQKKEALREVVKAGLAELKLTGRKHYHPHEPEAKRMGCDGKNRFAYNAQAVVDQHSGVIVAAEVVSQENDVGQLVPMVEQAQANVPSGAGSAPVIVADSAYGTGADLALAAEKQLNVLVYPQEGGVTQAHAYHAKHFVYNPSAGTVHCPQGQSLAYKRTRQKRGDRVKLFYCQSRDCPVKAQCTKNRRGREITIWPHTPATQAMRTRLANPNEQARLSQRGQVIERVFGHFKEHQGFRRFTVRGLAGVNAQWALLCCTTNLQVLFAFWGKQRILRG